MSDALIAFAKAMDRCWIEHRFDDLAGYLDPKVVMVAPGGEHRLSDLASAIENYRAFMAQSDVQRFHTSSYTVTERGDTTVIEYAWDMAWTTNGAIFDAKGREVLVLARREAGWRVIWRMQIAN